LELESERTTNRNVTLTEERTVLKFRELLLRYMHASAVGDTDGPIAAP